MKKLIPLLLIVSLACVSCSSSEAWNDKVYVKGNTYLWHLELQQPVWNDINVGSFSLSAPIGLQPDIELFVDELGGATNISTYALAPTEYLSGSFELLHDYKEGTDLYFHVHWQGKAAPTGTDNVQWQLEYVIARHETTLNPITTITIETPFDTQYEFKRSDFALIAGAGFVIGDQFLFRLSRIAASVDEYAGDALLATVGIHYQIDTIGSSTLENK